AEPELTRGAIYLVETGRSRPSMATLGLISTRTGRPISHFLSSRPLEEAQDATAGLSARIAAAELDCLRGAGAEAIAAAQSVLQPVPDLTLAAACTIAGDVLASQQHWAAAAARYGQGLERARRCAGLAPLARHYEELVAAFEGEQRHGLAAEWRQRALTLRSA